MKNSVIWVIFTIEGVTALPMLSSAQSGNQAVIYMREKARGASERDHFPREAGKWKVINCGDKRMRRDIGFSRSRMARRYDNHNQSIVESFDACHGRQSCQVSCQVALYDKSKFEKLDNVFIL